MSERKYSDKDQDILNKVEQYIADFNAYWYENRQKGNDDLYFLRQDMWTSSERAQFAQLQKPALQCNILHNHVTKVIGEFRKNTPTLTVLPAPKQENQTEKDLEVEQKLIDAKQDALNNILFHSQANRVWQTAIEDALTRGYGAIEIATDYEDAYAFNQDIFLYPVLDPDLVFFDPMAEKPSKCDGKYIGKFYYIDKNEFEKIYGFTPEGSSYVQPLAGGAFNWITKDTVAVVDLYVKEHYKFELVLLDDGRTMTRKQYNKRIKERDEILELNEKITESNNKSILDGALDALTPFHEVPIVPNIEMTRHSQDYRIMHYKLVKGKILEKKRWSARTFPIMMVLGDCYRIGQQEFTTSYIHYARDIQKYANFLLSDMAQVVKYRSREEWSVTPENIEGLETHWANPERQGPVKISKRDETGQKAEKIPPSEIPPTLLQQFEMSIANIDNVVGRYGANLGAPGNERSGIAIENRIRQGEGSTYIFHDNLLQTMEDAGRCIIEVMKTVYDSERVLHLNNKKGKFYKLPINYPGALDFTKGDFYVRIEPTAPTALQHADAIKLILQFAELPPPVQEKWGDIIAKLIDVENKDEVIERARMLTDPAIIAKEEGKPPPPKKPNPKLMLEQHKMQLEAKELQIKEQELQLKHMEQEIDYIKELLGLQATTRKAQAEEYKAQMDASAEIVSAMDRLKQDEARYREQSS